VQTGTVTTHPIPLPGATYAFFEFDPATGKLYSISSAPGFPLATIDPNTGVVQTIQSTGSFTGVSSVGAFDPVGRRLFFLADASGVATLVVVNVQTGTVTTHPIPLPGATYAFFEFAGPTVTAVPMLSPTGLICVGALLALAGVLLAKEAR
jgi:hypothetical protein